MNRGVHVCDNFIDGEYVAPKAGKYKDILSPHSDQVIGEKMK